MGTKHDDNGMDTSLHKKDDLKPHRIPHILLGLTGSIATVKGPRLALRLASELKAHVKVILTRTVEQHLWQEGQAVPSYDENSWKEFGRMVQMSLDKKKDMIGNDGMGNRRDELVDWETFNGSISVYYANDDWHNYNNLRDPVLHIQLRSWADILLIAPLSAHTLAKIANGICDDLLTCCLRAWDFGSCCPSSESERKMAKPVIVAPAMNTAMWEHPLTKQQLCTIQGFWNIGDYSDKESLIIVPPAIKRLACGDVGTGALAELDDILYEVKNCLVSCNVIHDDSDSFHSNRNKTKKNCSVQYQEKRVAIKTAILRLAKEMFQEMQSAHCDTHQNCQQQHPIQQLSMLAAPISPTPHDTVEEFLSYLQLSPKSLLVDLGCGDGRWLIQAATLTKCHCLGVDIDTERLALAKLAIEKLGLESTIQLRNQDIFDFMERDVMFWKADAFVMYLFRDAMIRMGSLLRQRRKRMRKEVLVLCVGFAMPGWTPLQQGWKGTIRVYLYNIAEENGMICNK